MSKCAERKFGNNSGQYWFFKLSKFGVAFAAMCNVNNILKVYWMRRITLNFWKEKKNKKHGLIQSLK